MAARKSNPRVLVRVLGIAAIAVAVGVGYGVPAFLLRGGAHVNDPEALSRIIGQVLGGGLGLGGVLIVLSFFMKRPEG